MMNIQSLVIIMIIGENIKNTIKPLSDNGKIIRCGIVPQNVRGLKKVSKLENVIALMEMNNVDYFLAQETWIKPDYIKEIQRYTIFSHSLQMYKLGRGEMGVLIMLSPKFTNFYEAIGGLPPIVAKGSDSLEGRHIEIDLLIDGCKKVGAFQKKEKRQN